MSSVEGAASAVVKEEEDKQVEIKSRDIAKPHLIHYLQVGRKYGTGDFRDLLPMHLLPQRYKCNKCEEISAYYIGFTCTWRCTKGHVYEIKSTLACIYTCLDKDKHAQQLPSDTFVLMSKRTSDKSFLLTNLRPMCRHAECASTPTSRTNPMFPYYQH